MLTKQKAYKLLCCKTRAKHRQWQFKLSDDFLRAKQAHSSVGMIAKINPLCQRAYSVQSMQFIAVELCSLR